MLKYQTEDSFAPENKTIYFNIQVFQVACINPKRSKVAERSFLYKTNQKLFP